MSRFLAAVGPLLGRVLLSVVFLYAGYQKIVVAPGRAAASIAGRGLPFAHASAYAAGALELVVGCLLVIGLRARLASLLGVAYLAIVTFLFHWHPAARGDVGQVLHLLKNAGVAGGLLLVASFGPGPASVDRH